MIAKLLRKVSDKLEGRSPHWGTVRAAHLKLEPECQACGDKDKLEVHHLRSFHEWPLLELEPENLLTMCSDCHFFVGHLKSWKSINVNCRTDAAQWREKITNRPKPEAK